MTTAGRHAQIVESLQTPEGVVVREDYRDYPRGVSNLYLLAADSKIKWEADLPQIGDIFVGGLRLDGGHVRCTTWHGHSCLISLSTGKIVSTTFTK